MSLLDELKRRNVIRVTGAYLALGWMIVEMSGTAVPALHLPEWTSVRKAGNTVRITAQPIRAADSVHLWSETYDRNLDDIFAVQDEISGAVVEQLKIKLLGEAPKAKAVNPAAYALYLQARQLDRLAMPGGWKRAAELLEQALTIDPDFAAAWVWLADVHISMGRNGLRPPDESFRIARNAKHKALEIDPENALAHSSLGAIAELHDNDLASAARHYKRALEIDPNAIYYAAGFAEVIGHLDTATALWERSIARDPMDPWSQHGLGLSLISAGRFDEAMARFRVARKLAPEAFGSEISLTFLFTGQAEAALTAAQDVGETHFRLAIQSAAYHSLGRVEESNTSLAKLIREFAAQSGYDIASVHAWRGEADRAFERLQHESQSTPIGRVGYVAIDPLFTNLHTDPRWLPFLRKIGRAPEQLAAIEFEVKLPQ